MSADFVNDAADLLSKHGQPFVLIADKDPDSLNYWYVYGCGDSVSEAKLLIKNMEDVINVLKNEYDIKDEDK